MKEYERKQLLERVEREGATVGASIPEAVDLDGETLDLRAFVFETRRVETVPAEERERVDAVKKKLRRARLQRKQRLEDEGAAADLSYGEGERLVEEIVGIERALNALQDVSPTDIEDEIDRKERADKKRWYGFLKRALGRESDASGRGRTGGGGIGR